MSSCVVVMENDTFSIYKNRLVFLDNRIEIGELIVIIICSYYFHTLVEAQSQLSLCNLAKRTTPSPLDDHVRRGLCTFTSLFPAMFFLKIMINYIHFSLRVIIPSKYSSFSGRIRHEIATEIRSILFCSARECDTRVSSLETNPSQFKERNTTIYWYKRYW